MLLSFPPRPTSRYRRLPPPNVPNVSEAMGGGAPTCSFVPDKGMFLLKNPKGKSLNTYGSHLPQERQSSACAPAHPKCEEGEANEGGNGHAEPPSAVGNKVTGTDAISENNASAEMTSAKSSAEAVDKVDRGESNSKPKAPPQQTQLYLFIEEVLFLHERGLIEAYSDADEKDRLESKQLFAMLPKLGVAFPVYLTYAHLRAQTYIVMRHAPRRLDIVDALAERSARKRKRDEREAKESMEADGGVDAAAANATSEPKAGIDLDNGDEEDVNKSRGKRSANLKKRLRAVEFNARAPILMRSTDSAEKWTQYLPLARSSHDVEHQEELVEEEHHAVPRACTLPSTSPIAYDVYGPNSAFKRTDPGRPEFCVAIASYAEASPGFRSINALVSIARGVPVRISTVADGGTVVMFSLTNYGVPPLAKIKASSLAAGNAKKETGNNPGRS